jgi:hypothetical protein
MLIVKKEYLIEKVGRYNKVLGEMNQTQLESILKNIVGSDKYFEPKKKKKKDDVEG